MRETAAGWQVRAEGAGTPLEGDGGVWWSFTVTAPTSVYKLTPGNGATGLGVPVVLHWTSVPGDSYQFCWDTTNNDACDGTWTATAYPSAELWSLTPGTYYWPFDLPET